MEKHVLKLLALVDAKTITKPASPPFPDIRQNTTIKLGEETWDAEARREVRQRLWAEYCKGVAEDPESFSPVIMIPEIDASLIGKTIEVRWNLADGTLHCYDGKIIEFKEKVDGLRTKNASALVEWDPVHSATSMWVPLNPKLYASETRHRGWNMTGDDDWDEGEEEQIEGGMQWGVLRVEFAAVVDQERRAAEARRAEEGAVQRAVVPPGGRGRGRGKAIAKPAAGKKRAAAVKPGAKGAKKWK